MARTRIVVVTPEFPTREWPHRGRPVYQTVRQLQAFADVQVLCPLPVYPGWLRPSFDHRQTDLSFMPPGLAARYIEFPAVPWISRPLNGVVCAQRLEPHIRSFCPDTILNYWLYPAGFAAVSVGRKLGIPVIVGAIGSDLNAIGDPISRWLTRRTLKEASMVIAKSQQLRKQAIAMGADSDKIHVVPNGCDANVFSVRDRNTARLDIKIPASAELILYVGRMDRAKGIVELLDAAMELSASRPELRLVYVGDGPELGSMQARTAAANLQDHVYFAGACSMPEVARWMAAANLLALPSYAEGCPNVIIEAMRCGRPVVATSVGGIPELVDGRCGLLVPPRQADALRDALDTALGLVWDEHEIANHFSRTWEQVAKEVFAICELSRQNVRI